MMIERLTEHVARRRLLYLLGITAVGAFLRLLRLADLPPGDGYDVAQYGLDALEILAGARPVFLPANFGREPLFSYAVALAFGAVGPGAFAIHLTSALIGIATIPAVYGAARALLAEEAAGARLWISLLAAAVTAVSYWHLTYSRAGLRVIWVPLFAALLSAALARGLHRGSLRWLAAAGLLLGLSLYTYQAARLLPLLALAGFVYTYAARRQFGRREVIELLICGGAALLIFAPLGWYALQNPAIFNDRLRQTALLAGEAAPAQQVTAVLAQTGRALAMYAIRGDNEPLYTIPGRPSFNPFLALFLVVGIVAAARRWRRPAWLYLLTWLALLTAPAMIADQAATAKRALGAFPAAAILIGAGLVLPWAAWRARHMAGQAGGGGDSDAQAPRPTGGNGRAWVGGAWLGLLLLGLLGTAVVTYRDYFFRWGADPALAAHFQRDHSEVGLAAAAAAPQELVFISPFDAAHPAIRLNSGDRPLRGYDGHRCLIIPAAPAGGARYIIVPGETERSLERLAQIFPGGETRRGNLRPDRAAPYTQTYVVPPGATPQTAGLVAAGSPYVWDGWIALRGSSVAREEGGLRVTLLYEALADGAADYTATVQLLGAPQAGDGRAIYGQADSPPCRGAAPTGQWRAGDLILDEVLVNLPEPPPPGAYTLVTGFYSWPEIAPLPLTAPEGAETAVLAEFQQ